MAKLGSTSGGRSFSTSDDGGDGSSSSSDTESTPTRDFTDYRRVRRRSSGSDSSGSGGSEMPADGGSGNGSDNQSTTSNNTSSSSSGGDADSSSGSRYNSGREKTGGQLGEEIVEDEVENRTGTNVEVGRDQQDGLTVDVQPGQKTTQEERADRRVGTGGQLGEDIKNQDTVEAQSRRRKSTGGQFGEEAVEDQIEENNPSVNAEVGRSETGGFTVDARRRPPSESEQRAAFQQVSNAQEDAVVAAQEQTEDAEIDTSGSDRLETQSGMGIAAGLSTQDGAARTSEIIRESGSKPASEVRENVNPVSDLLEKSAENVTPHARMVIGDDEDGLTARAEREELFAERAEQGVDKLLSGGLPSKKEAGAMLFQGAEVVERGLTDTGRGIAEASPTAGMGPELGDEAVGSVPGNVVEGLVGGLGAGVGAVGQLPTTAAADLTGDATTDGETPTEAVGNMNLATNTVESQAELLKDRPASTALLFALPAAEAPAKFSKGYRTGKADTTVPYEAITDASGAKGGVSKFETSTDAPTSKATAEIRARAKNQPDAVKEAAGSESVLYHTTGDSFGNKVKVGEGSSELPGLWTAPDANSVGLRSTSFGQRARSFTDSLRPRRPDLSTSPDRVAAFEGETIRAMAESATESGYELRAADGTVLEQGLGRGQAKAKASEMSADVEVAPDQSTSGYEFLNEQADPGTAYVRPTGSRTPELEAIYGPETQFTQATGGPRVNVRVGGREVNIPYTDRSVTVGGEKLPMDFYRRAGESPETSMEAVSETRATTAEGRPIAGEGRGSATEAAVAEGRGSATEAVVAGSDIAGSYRSLSDVGRPSGTPVTSYGAAFGATAVGARGSTGADVSPTASATASGADIGRSYDYDLGSDSSPTPRASSGISFGRGSRGPSGDSTDTGGGGGSSLTSGSSRTPPPGSPSGSGSDSPPIRTPDDPPQRPPRLRGSDSDSDEDEIMSELEGTSYEYSYDFVDPLTGGVIKTESPTSESQNGVFEVGGL